MSAVSLVERIKALRVEADEFIDRKAAALSEATPGVPIHVLREWSIRNLLVSRAYGCQCQAVLNNSDDEHVREKDRGSPSTTPLKGNLTDV
jgi:hypothetical protein